MIVRDAIGISVFVSKDSAISRMVESTHEMAGIINEGTDHTIIKGLYWGGD